MAASKKAPDPPSAFHIAPQLYAALSRFLKQRRPDALLVAWSGGRDSTVLLHALRQLQPQAGFDLRAVHVNHRLQPVADEWAEHCRSLAQSWGVPCEAIAVKVEKRRRGWEAAAREARYEALAQSARRGEWVLTAHHQQDQAETVLLNLIRGSGTAGLRGMQPVRFLKEGTRLARPLLDVPVETLAAYADHHDLIWVEDAHNLDPAFLRTHIRRRWLPLMAEQAPTVVAQLAHVAAWQRETWEIVVQWAQDALANVAHDTNRLYLADCRRFSVAQRKAILQHWFFVHHGVRLNRRQLAQLHAWFDMRPDAQPELRIGKRSARGFLGWLYYPAVVPQWRATSWDERERLPFRIELAADAASSEDAPPPDVLIPFVEWGSPIKPFKKAFRQAGVPPWLRPAWPVALRAGRPMEILGVARLDDRAASPRFCAHFIAGNGGIR